MHQLHNTTNTNQRKWENQKKKVETEKCPVSVCTMTNNIQATNAYCV